MHLNPYGEFAILLAADLANRRPASIEELVTRCVDAGVVVDYPVSQEDLPLTLAVVDEWTAVADTPAGTERADRLNAVLAEASAYPRMTNHAEDGWHLHYRDDKQSLAAVLQALFSVGTALHLIGRGMHRLARCALDECDNIFADTSRNGRQRYCSPTCSNRDAVRRHRALKSPA